MRFMPGFLPGGLTTTKLSTVLTSLGLTSNLQLVLDAGDAASYTSGQKWLDRSGNGYDFFRGSSSSSQSSDPTFNGTAGGLSSSEYWSFDGGDFFTYDSANETWMDNLHKNNASWTYLGWLYFGNLDATNNGIFGTGDAALLDPLGVFLLTSTPIEALRLVVGNDAETAALQQNSSLPLSINTWHFCGVSIAEATGVGFFNVDNASEEFSASYTSPSAGAAEKTMEMGRLPETATRFSSGSRMGQVAMWSTALTVAQMNQVFQATRGRFGV